MDLTDVEKWIKGADDRTELMTRYGFVIEHARAAMSVRLDDLVEDSASDQEVQQKALEAIRKAVKAHGG